MWVPPAEGPTCAACGVPSPIERVSPPPPSPDPNANPNSPSRSPLNPPPAPPNGGTAIPPPPCPRPENPPAPPQKAEVRTPGSTHRHTLSALMAPPPPTQGRMDVRCQSAGHGLCAAAGGLHDRRVERGIRTGRCTPFPLGLCRGGELQPRAVLRLREGDAPAQGHRESGPTAPLCVARRNVCVSVRVFVKGIHMKDSLCGSRLHRHHHCPSERRLASVTFL